MKRLMIGTLLAGALSGGTAPAQITQRNPPDRVSSAKGGPGDIREPGIQGDVPVGQTASYNCGIKMIGQLPVVGVVQGAGKCAYVRTGSNMEDNKSGEVHVIDVSNPAKPIEVGKIPVKMASETMRAIVTNERAVLVSGSSVYDISDCLHPVLLGEIKWPPLTIGNGPPSGGGGGPGLLPHDLRLNHSGTKVYASLGLWEADITNLHDPSSWKVIDYRCDLAPQVKGPWQETHRQGQQAGINLCADMANSRGADGRVGVSRMQYALTWPTLSHSLDVNGNGTRVYLGDQKIEGTRNLGEPPKIRIIDVTKRPVQIVGQTDGPGHGLDWFRAGGREYVLHSNEIGSSMGAEAQAPGIPGDTCRAYPRPSAVGWGFEAFVSDVTGDQAKNVSMLQIAINNPEYCEARKASGRDPTIAYHLIDNPSDAHFAALNFGSAGLRIYDIRDPQKPSEVAYYNHGPLVHGGVGYYDSERGLIYAAGGTGFWVLKLGPQVRARLGL